MSLDDPDVVRAELAEAAPRRLLEVGCGTSTRTLWPNAPRRLAVDGPLRVRRSPVVFVAER